MKSKSPILKQAWDYWHASLEVARQMIESTPRLADPAHRAQAYHALVEAQAMAYNWVIAPRLNHPRIFTHTAWSTNVYSIAGNCPDFIYGMLPLDGRHTYRIRGRHGDVPLLWVQVYSRPMGVDGSRCVGIHEFVRADMPGDEFELVLGAAVQPGHWIELDGASDFNVVVLRRLLPDWNGDPGELEVEMTGTLQGYDELSESATARRIEMAADFHIAAVRNWVIGLFDFTLALTQNRYNFWAPVPEDMMASVAISNCSQYGFLLWNLQPDEALLIEMEVPAGSAYWSFQAVDVWSKSLDFMHEQTDFNLNSAVIDDDGKVRAVLSAVDPGVPNWLNTLERHQGLCVVRNYRSPDFSMPTAEVVKLSELRDRLPKQTPLISAQQRAQAVARRRPALLGLYRG